MMFIRPLLTLAILVTVLAPSLVGAQEPLRPTQPAAAVAWPYPWQVGEVLEYDIIYGVLNVGTVRCSTHLLKTNGVDHVLIQVKVKSNRLISTVYPIEGTLGSIVEPSIFRPIRSTRIMREGKRRTDEVNIFDRQTAIGTWFTRIGKKKKTFRIGPDTHDILSFMYHLRAAEMKVGGSTKVQVMSDEKVYDLELNYTKTDRFKVAKKGKRESILIRPTARFNGLLALKEKGDISAWVSTDPRKVCTKLVAQTPFADVKIVLRKVSGPGADFWVK